MTTSTPTRWLRVSRQAPCAVCSRPDWCTYTPDGVACCMRVQSDRPAKNGGWIHRSPSPTPFIPAPTPEVPQIDAASIMGKWLRETRPDARQALSARLGVSEHSLGSLDAAYANQHAAWAFPMRDGQGSVVGIRLRADDGRKWAVRGSRQGIFVPSVMSQQVALICEGPTDTAAAVSIGFFAIGRPSCNTGGPQIAATVRRLGIHRVVMVADNDAPGLQGAARVAAEIGLPHVTFIPPCKDLRQLVQAGGTREMVQSQIAQQVWRR
jgi:hypothetical protein